MCVCVCVCVGSGELRAATCTTATSADAEDFLADDHSQLPPPAAVPTAHRRSKTNKTEKVVVF